MLLVTWPVCGEVKIQARLSTQCYTASSLVYLYTYPLSFPYLMLPLTLPLPFSSFSQQIIDLTLFLRQVSCLVLAETDPWCAGAKALGSPLSVPPGLWLVPSLCAWLGLPEIPGVGAF